MTTPTSPNIVDTFGQDGHLRVFPDKNNGSSSIENPLFIEDAQDVQGAQATPQDVEDVEDVQVSEEGHRIGGLAFF